MKYKVTLNNTVYEVEVERGEAILADEYQAASPAPAVAAAPVAAAPAAAAPVAAVPAAAALAAGEVVPSPLPGSIFKIIVSEGQAVKQGDLLVVIEAMKMENEVLAPKDGTVRQIAVKQGAQIATGDALVVLG